ncbi:hypothetical protein B0H14DRAFT_2160004, partial [Mycena olivaceomarginata]
GGTEWAQCVGALIGFERSCGFPEKGLPVPQGGAAVRPEEVPAFFQRARKWDKEVTLTSKMGPAAVDGSFAERWWKWWMRVQPEARSEKLGPVENVTREGWGEVLQMAGKNGMLLFVGALVWWGEAAAKDGEAEVLLQDWKIAVGDVARVLTTLSA